MSEPLTVYTLPNCIQCTLTKRALDKTGLPYQVIDLTDNEDARTLVTRLGYQSAPIVITDTEHWSGYRPDKIAATTARSRTLDSNL